MPALPLHEAGKYVAAAYVVLFAIVLIYVAIMAIRLSRIERELGELLALPERSPERTSASGLASAPGPGRAEIGQLDVGRPGQLDAARPGQPDAGRPESTPA